MLRLAMVFFVLGLLTLLSSLSFFGALSADVGLMLLGTFLILGIMSLLISVIPRRPSRMLP